MIFQKSRVSTVNSSNVCSRGVGADSKLASTLMCTGRNTGGGTWGVR